MSKYKNMLTLNPDYYCAYMYDEKRKEEHQFLKALIQFLAVLVFIMALFFIYKFIEQRNLLNFNFFEISSLKEDLVEKKVKNIIKGKEIRKVINVVVEKPIKIEVEPAILKTSTVLTDEYIELVKKSLGNN